MNPKLNTFGDVFENYPSRVAWKMIFASMVRNLKRGMEKPRFKKCSNNAVKIRRKERCVSLNQR
jgi:hypothetical protein